jgi:segregation and condensation protein A
MMNRLSGERIYDLSEEVSVNEKITLMTELLEERGECSFTDLVGHGSIMDVVCAFLAVLESVKIRLICIFQNRMFGDIQIRTNQQTPPEIMQEDGEKAAADGVTLG